ncbi:MAG: hypothetical protein ABIP51_07415 [Bacteroidia bacterium]
MNFKITFRILFVIIAIAFTFCKKPKSGEYTYEESGVKSSYLSESGGPYNQVKKSGYTNSNTSKFKNKHNKTLYVDNIPWVIKDDSATYRGNTITTSSPNNSFQSAYSYRGLVKRRIIIEGEFTVVQVTHSYFNIYIDTIIGTFKYTKD